MDSAAAAPCGTLGPDFIDFLEFAPVAAFAKDAYGRYVYANPYLLATLGKHMGCDWYGKTDADMWPSESAAAMRAADEEVLSSGRSLVFSRVMPVDGQRHTVLLTEFPLPLDAGVGVAGIGVDITEFAKKGEERDWLIAAIAQVTESVVITDREARIIYVNAAFERVTGYAREEVIGLNPRILQSGLQTPWFYDGMWAALTSGMPWVADFVNRRKDGSLFTEEAVISPIRDSSGAITSFIAIKRDVTQERALAERSTQAARERALIAETIRDIRPGDTPEATAQAICRQVVTFAGVKAVQVSLFETDGRAMPIGLAIAGLPDPPLRKLGRRRSRQLRARAVAGPWIEPWVNEPRAPYNQILSRLGLQSAAYAPVRSGGRLIGLLSMVAEGSVGEAAAAEMLPALVEFADLAGAVVGPVVVERAEMAGRRHHIEAVIGRRAFHPVFQPIVDLHLDVPVGYEALTRFTDGVNAEVVFAQAAAVGLGAELEVATLQAALGAAEALPQSAWLNLNASPDLILAREPLRSLLRGVRRHLVLEVTEHTAITDYQAFRTAMAALGPNVKLAVDDAGVGFASLRHILELRPAFVKLDRWLVAGLESDEARSAMIVGLCHFARSTGCRLIAEGIETKSEEAVLQSLGIRLGQGFLLGRPLPVGDAGGAGSAIRPVAVAGRA
jgi:PAS domain S-box-containing protein